VAYALHDLVGGKVEEFSLKDVAIRAQAKEGLLWDRIKGWIEGG